LTESGSDPIFNLNGSRRKPNRGRDHRPTEPTTQTESNPIQFLMPWAHKL